MTGSSAALLPVATPERVRRAVGQLVRPHWRLAALSVGALVAAAAASLVVAPLLGSVVDIAALARRGSAAGSLTTPVVGLVAAALVQGAFAVVGFVLVARLGEQVLATLRESFVERALRLPLDRIEQGGTGDLTARVTQDVTAISDAVRSAVPELARSAFVVALTFVGLASLDWRFGLAALAPLPVQVITTRWYVRRSVPAYRQERVVLGAQHQQLLDTVGGARTVRAFRLAPRHLAAVGRRADAAIAMTFRLLRLSSGFFGGLTLSGMLGLAAVLLAGYLLVDHGAVSVGTATAAALYFANLYGPVNVLLFLLADVQTAAAGLARLVGVVDLPAPAEPSTTRSPGDGSVTAGSLSYHYRAGHEVVSGIDLTVADRTQVALVGASGAGKSTVAAILAGIRRPTAGTVEIGGIPLIDLGTRQLRRTVALVTQEVHVFAGPLSDDLRMAAPDAGEDRLRAALDRVGALGWAEALPDGLDTVVGAGGVPLGVVQAQQLALARVVLLDPPVVILDEATAEAGSAGAQQLEAAARAALAGRTGIVIAHRLTQASAADTVVVMEGGRVVERGNHADLVAAGAGYARLWAAWTAQS